MFLTVKPGTKEKDSLSKTQDKPGSGKIPSSRKYSGAAATPPLAWEERRKEKEYVFRKARIT
jgi:hypothetical protein